MARMHVAHSNGPPPPPPPPAPPAPSAPIVGPRSARLRLDLLHSFEAAARLLSFTAAGQALSLSQSAVSRQIQQLEDNLGTPLFERRHRALALTEAGRVLQRAVEDSLARLDDAAARIRPVATPRDVAITCTPGFASFWLIPRLARFTAAHPGVDVRISATLEVLDLARSRVDVAVRFVPTAHGRGPLLFEESVVPLCARSLLADPSRPLRAPSDLHRHTLLTVDYSPASSPTLDWEPWLQLMAVPDVRPASTLRFSQYAEAVAAAVAGQGIVIGRLPLLADLVKRRQLVAPFGGRAASRRGYFLELAPHAQANAHARDLAAWLLAEASAPPPAAA